MQTSIIKDFTDRVWSSGLQKELRGWAILGISALAIAGVFALLLALSRIPGIENTFPWPLGFFEKGLVIHVIFSFVVWFLAVLGVLITAFTAYAGSTSGPAKLIELGRQALWAAGASCVLLSVPALVDSSEASLNNYIPIIIDPRYYIGLIVFAMALSVIIVRFVINVRANGLLKTAYGELATALSLIFVVALICFVLAYLPRMNDEINAGFNEGVFWGGGHVLQYLNTLMMLGGWYLLAHMIMGEAPVSRSVLRTVVLMITAPPLMMPVLYIVFPPHSAILVFAFTELQYLLAPPVLVMGLALVKSLGGHFKGQKLPWKNIAFLSLILSAMTFAIGGFLGLFVDGMDTRTPAHYHAVIAGVNIVFMGLFLIFVLNVLGRAIEQGRSTRALIWLYAVGQMVASIGLFMAGGYGAPRKTAGGDQGLVDIGAITGLYLNGIGAAIAVIGGIMFIWVCARALSRK